MCTFSQWWTHGLAQISPGTSVWNRPRSCIPTGLWPYDLDPRSVSFSVSFLKCLLWGGAFALSHVAVPDLFQLCLGRPANLINHGHHAITGQWEDSAGAHKPNACAQWVVTSRRVCLSACGRSPLTLSWQQSVTPLSYPFSVCIVSLRYIEYIWV